MAFQADFDLDIPRALHSQLITVFEGLDTAPLGKVLGGDLAVSSSAGVYGLYLRHTLVYVGKARNLIRRLAKHRFKISGRHKITIDDMEFKCITVHRNWNAYAPESILIGHYRSEDLCEWNGSGFGPNDPGRNRETTNKPPDGFDAQYPIRSDWPCDWIEPGRHGILDLLISLKEGLPYLLRYQIDSPSYRTGHRDFANNAVHVPVDNIPAADALRLIVQQLPGWQATEFPSHLILYKENRGYGYGAVITRNSPGRR